MKLFENEVLAITRIHTVNMYESTQKKKVSYNVTLPVYELIFKMSGNNIVNFGAKTLDESQNAVRYLPKGITSGEYTVDVLEPGCCIDIYFDTADEMPDVAAVLKNMTELKPLFLKICNIWNAKKTGYYSECMSIFYDIIKRIKIHGDRYSTSEKTRRVIPSFEYMLNHYFEPDFNYERMCEQSGLSYSYFKELFIKRYGISPVKYVTNLRMEKAKELLITGQYSVTETAEMCGFDSVYYFSRLFKSHTGVAPSNYKISDKV